MHGHSLPIRVECLAVGEGQLAGMQVAESCEGRDSIQIAAMVLMEENLPGSPMDQLEVFSGRKSETLAG